MITKRFARRVNEAFQKLNYLEKDNFDIDEFQKAAFKSITNAVDFDDAYDALTAIRFVFKKHEKIEKLFRRKHFLVENFEYTGKPFDNKLKDEDAYGIYYVTDGIFRKEITAVGLGFVEEKIFNFLKNKSHYKMYTDSEYSFRFSFWSNKAYIYKNGECICVLIYNGSQDVYEFKENLSDYEIMMDDGLIDIYEKEYISKVNDNVDIEESIATIGSFYTGLGFGMATMHLFGEGDSEFFMIIATLAFLLKGRYYTSRSLMFVSFTFSNIFFMINATLAFLLKGRYYTSRSLMFASLSFSNISNSFCWGGF